MASLTHTLTLPHTRQAPTPPGSHLASPGPYQEQIAKLIGKFPNLKYPSYDLRYKDSAERPAVPSTPRFAVLRFEGTDQVERLKLENLSELREHLISVNEDPTCGTQPPTRELLLLEGMTPDYVATIGAAMAVDPLVFMRHQRTALWEDDHHGGNTPLLLSQFHASSSFVLDYRELRFFDRTFESYFVRSADDNRHIAMSSVNEEFDRVGIVDRRVSFWSRSLPGGDWQGEKSLLLLDWVLISTSGILICDKPVQKVVVGREVNARQELMLNEPFQGGYPDPIDYSSVDETVQGPPRTALFDDLCHYFEHYPGRLSISAQPDSALLFLKLILAAHFTMLLVYTRGVFDHLESILGRRTNFALQDFVNSVTPFWADLHHFNRRCQYFQHDLASNIVQLGLSDLQTAPSALSPADKNFLFLQRQFDEVASKSRALFMSFSNLSGIAGSRQSLIEARNVWRLSILGVVFLPLSFTSGMFSTSGEFLPGQSHFWVYIVVSVSIILGIFAIPLWHDSLSWLVGAYSAIRSVPSKIKARTVQVEKRRDEEAEAAWLKQATAFSGAVSKEQF